MSWTVAQCFVKPGNTATDARPPSFQTMIDVALLKPPAFDVIVVHPLSRFFRHQFRPTRARSDLAGRTIRPAVERSMATC